MERKPLYTFDEAKALTESLVDQDTKFNREVEALINTEEAKEILLTAYKNADDNAKMSIADATEQQFLDKYAPDGSAKDKDEEKDDNSNVDASEENDDFLDDATGLENAPDPAEGTVDDGGSEDDQDIIDDGGSEDDQDTANADIGIGSDNIFAQATSGDEDGTLTDTEGDNAGNPFLESKKTPKKKHSLNESRAAARKAKATRSSLKKMNESKECDADDVACMMDDRFYGKIWKFLEARTSKLGTREKIIYLKRVMQKPEIAKGIAEKIAIKMSLDMSEFGKDWQAQMARVISKVAGDQYDLGEY